jgi:hypothetical protein
MRKGKSKQEREKGKGEREGEERNLGYELVEEDSQLGLGSIKRRIASRTIYTRYELLYSNRER